MKHQHEHVKKSLNNYIYNDILKKAIELTWKGEKQ